MKDVVLLVAEAGGVVPTGAGRTQGLDRLADDSPVAWRTLAVERRATVDARSTILAADPATQLFSGTIRPWEIIRFLKNNSYFSRSKYNFNLYNHKHKLTTFYFCTYRTILF